MGLGIINAIGLLFSIIVAVAPTILAHLNEKRKEVEHDTKALIDRDRDVLRDGLDGLRQKPPL